ncbi:unnamed protein product [Rotaria sordida]|uniref:Uncharacterized protein n=1 Tax=Rotaria sordida TaxID=392033 RepID=A0A819SY24_9BILA|nr:unnamed protein product [Rotaria sordida]CAF4063713.1 unnamed protein product [Rotaria sordida]
MVELLTKQQIRNAAERQFKKYTYKYRIGINEVILENFMVIVDFLLNEEKQPNEDDDFPDDEEIDQRYKDFVDKISDLADNDQTLTSAMLKQLLKDFKLEKHKD